MMHFAPDDPEVQLNHLIDEVRARMEHTANDIRSQTSKASAGDAAFAAAGGSPNIAQQVLTFAIITGATLILAEVLPELLGLDVAAAGAEASAGARAALSAEELAAEEGISLAAADAAAEGGVVPIVADTGLPVSTTFTSNGYTFVTDGLGRVVNVSGELELGPGATVSQRTAAAIRQLGNQETDQAGHMIAKIFNGPNERINLLPQNSNLNQGVWRSMERTWAEALQNGDRVSVNIEIRYSGAATRPTGFSVDSSISDETMIFRNSPGGR